MNSSQKDKVYEIVDIIKRSHIRAINITGDRDVKIIFEKGDKAVWMRFEDPPEWYTTPFKKVNDIVDVDVYHAVLLSPLLLAKYEFLKKYTDRTDLSVAHIRSEDDGLSGVIVCQRINMGFVK